MWRRSLGPLLVLLTSSATMGVACAVANEPQFGDDPDAGSDPRGGSVDAGRDGSRTQRDSGPKPDDASGSDGSSSDGGRAQDGGSSKDAAVDAAKDGPTLPPPVDAGPVPDGGGVTIVPAGHLINVDFGSATTTKTGAAALGNSSTDQWNAAGPGFNSDYTVSNLIWGNGAPSSTALRAENLPGNWGFSGTNLTDPMWGSYSYTWGGANAWITLSSLPAGTYDFLLYGHAAADSNNTGFAIELYGNGGDAGLSDASAEAGGATDGGLGTLQITTPTLYTTTQGDWDLPYWRNGSQYVRHTGIVVASGDVVRVVLFNGPLVGTGNAGCLINGMQIYRQ